VVKEDPSLGWDPGGGIQKRHIIQSGPRHVPAECSRGEACPLSNGHHFSFALPTDVIIMPPCFDVLASLLKFDDQYLFILQKAFLKTSYPNGTL